MARSPTPLSKSPRPKPTIAALARGKSAQCIKVLAEIVVNGDVPAPTRVAAAIALLDRGWGKPVPMVEADPADPISFGDISLEDVIAARAAIVDEC